MAVLDRKARRDLVRMWPQALAIAGVMAAGIATLIIGVGAERSLFETRQVYYERFRFGDVFASATRVPRHLIEEIRALPGVAAAEPRIAGRAILDIDGLVEPATARILSLPDIGEPAVNAVLLRDGRTPQPARPNEVVVSAAFADAQMLGLADELKATLHGRKRTLEIVGIAHSPEYIYALGPGELVPDDRRFGVIWLSEHAAEAAYEMQGAFNDVSLRLLRNASEAEAIDRLDALLRPYGGTGAYAREHQVSHAFLDGELKQLRAMARIMPPIFLAVGAFLVNMTLARLIALEREQIGLFKALGYGNWTIAAHYLRFALAISLGGVVLGGVAGLWLGDGLTRLYAEFFHFPFLYFTRSPQVYLLAVLVALVAGVAGALISVRRVVSLPPAVAMAPPVPPSYRRPWLERLGLMPRISQLSQMVARHLLRWPMRAGLTSLGISMSVALLVSSLFTTDSIELMIDVTFFRADRQAATLVFTEKEPLRTVEEVRHLPGVLAVEPVREVPIRIRYRHRERRTALVGKPAGASLSRVLDREFRPIALPREGLVLPDQLANILRVGAGERVEIDILDGSGRTLDAPVREVVSAFMGIPAYMDLTALNRLVGDGGVISGANFIYDQADEEAIFTAVKNLPAVASIALQKSSLAGFRETLAESLLIMTTVYVGLAATIAFGVVFNSARVRLSERARELASLRVLGFTKSEIYWVLFAELALITLAAIPIGWALGAGLAYGLVQSLASELYRIPFIISPATFAISALLVLAAAAASAIIVRRHVEKLDIIGVLKTRE